MASTFAELLRDFRIKAGLSQQALADQVGVNRAYIAMLETGQRHNPSRSTVAAVARALNLTVSERRKVSAALDDYGPPGPTTMASQSPVLEALAELLALPATSPLLQDRIIELYKRLSAALAARGVTPEQKKETRWLELVTKGYMYTPPRDRHAKDGGPGQPKRRRAPRSQKDEIRMGDRLRSLLEIFVDGRIPISRRAALAEDLLSLARWRVQKDLGPNPAAGDLQGRRPAEEK